MPRKPKQEKQRITVVVEGKPIGVTLYPPDGTRKSWYAYWTGLVTSKSTGQHEIGEAIKAAEDMLRNNGRKREAGDSVLTDEEFEEIQRRHYSKKLGENAQQRAAKSLAACLEAIEAFRSVSGLYRIASATAADCERFQDEALRLEKNWRRKYPKGKKDVGYVSSNTVLKWLIALQAAFERVNKNAGRKCVRGVVPEEKLLSANPWKQFTWIDYVHRPKRQFSGEELLSVLDYFERSWPGITVASLAVKVFLWSQARRSEIAGLKWASARVIDDEHHFDIIGKRAVRKWFRVPKRGFDELCDIRTDSPYVFAAYNNQLRAFHAGGKRASDASRVALQFSPENFGDWLHERLVDWSRSIPGGRATPHVFRKTALQFARAGEDRNELVARDAGLGKPVMLGHYVSERDEQLRFASCRTFSRILSALPAEVAERFGHDYSTVARLESELRSAVAAKNWRAAEDLARQLSTSAPA